MFARSQIRRGLLCLGATAIPYLVGRTVDVYRRADTEELLILHVKAMPTERCLKALNSKIHLTSAMAPNTADELMAWTAASAPTAVAFFDGSLFWVRPTARS